VVEQFALHVKGGLSCFDVSIGTYESKAESFKVKLDDPDLWHTEVSDAFRRAELQVEIV